MLRYIARRFLWMIPVILGVLIIVFVLMAIVPGDPVAAMVGDDASPEVKAEMRAKLGLDDPILVQFGRYVYNLVTKGDFGTSYTTNEPIRDELLKRLPVTLKLTLLSVASALILSVPLGVISAAKRYSWIDNLSMGVSLFGVSIPQFWFGLMLIMLFSVKMKVLPASGISKWQGWILPVAMIAFGNMGNFARTTRSSMLEIIQQDYMRTARSKGQSEPTILVKHGLRNAMIPILANVGNMAGVSMGGAVVAENIFSLPGVGKYMLDAINSRNWPAVQGGLVILAACFSIIMLIIDLLYAVIDPRLKSEFRKKEGMNLKRKAQVS